MIFNRRFISTLIVIFFFSCSSDKNSADEQAEEQTPEAFELTKTDVLKSTVSRRYENNIVDKLFDEACEKDQKLHELIKQQEIIDQMKNDSLKSYHGYIYNNNKYWAQTEFYVDRIKSEAIKQEARSLFERLQNEYEKSISLHDSALSRISINSQLLDDYNLLLKLVVTGDMMRVYQKNELPDISTLQRVENEYVKIIKETKKQISSNK